MSIRERTFPFVNDYPQAKVDLGLCRSAHESVRWKVAAESEWRPWGAGDEGTEVGRGGEFVGEVVLDFGSKIVGGFFPAS